MTTRMSEGALISYHEMEYRVHRARQVRAEFLGGMQHGLARGGACARRAGPCRTSHGRATSLAQLDTSKNLVIGSGS